jgi:hypothetical protein
MSFAFKNALIVLVLLFVVIFCLGIYWIFYLQKAHSTFENYYAFRGCVQLLNKTDNYGICKLASGKAIKIVKYQGRWFLDGDLPCGFLCF